MRCASAPFKRSNDLLINLDDATFKRLTKSLLGTPKWSVGIREYADTLFPPLHPPTDFRCRPNQCSTAAPATKERTVKVEFRSLDTEAALKDPYTEVIRKQEFREKYT